MSSIGKEKRMLVDEYNKVAGLDAVFAIGDSCLQTTDTAFPAGHPQVTQVSIFAESHKAIHVFLDTVNSETKPHQLQQGWPKTWLSWLIDRCM